MLNSKRKLKDRNIIRVNRKDTIRINSEERKNLLISLNNKQIVLLKIIQTVKKNKRIKLLSLTEVNNRITICSINRKLYQIINKKIVNSKVLTPIMITNPSLIQQNF